MVKNVCGALPADINVGFRVFGESPVWHPENPFPRCMASEQLILPGPLGSDHQRYNVFTRLMDERVRPGDGTPIPFAIEETLQDASMVDGPVSVIFLTDGSSTCGDPRTDVDFSKVSTNIDFHAYGFKLNRQAENEMRGVAEKLNGHFHQTNNRDLTKQVKEDLNNVMQGTVMPSAGYNFKNTETTPEGKPSK
jgi:hypothetical protein